MYSIHIRRGQGDMPKCFGGKELYHGNPVFSLRLFHVRPDLKSWDILGVNVQLFSLKHTDEINECNLEVVVSVFDNNMLSKTFLTSSVCEVSLRLTFFPISISSAETFQ